MQWYLYVCLGSNSDFYKKLYLKNNDNKDKCLQVFILAWLKIIALILLCIFLRNRHSIIQIFNQPGLLYFLCFLYIIGWRPFHDQLSTLRRTECSTWIEQSVAYTSLQGHSPSADLGQGEGDSFSPSALICAAIERKLMVWTLHMLLDALQK